ncbi:hypothetical protein [Parapedobacter soli]|uniref:hypothetical protein n=1 Tax=Parapedobacter soli TaxID=416955 RepID=UPI0021C809EF|nr:hypothetical protein [Parapedobacter soli]
MAIFDGKTIVLGAPQRFNWDSVIEAELENLGFNTINISFYGDKFKYKDRFQRLQSFFFREILGDRSYKTKLKFEASRDRLEEKLDALSVADYALIIRPDVYPIEFIKRLRTKVKKLIGYQWDGLDRFPDVYDYIGLFDRFFVFDGNDLTVPLVLPITNYAPVALCRNLHDEALQSDVYYSGSYEKQRIDELGHIIQDCRSLGLKVKYRLHYKKTIDLPYGLKTTTKSVAYDENVRYAYNTKVILDLRNPVHDGLSFRFFEALLFDKKVITDNPRAMEYDFYHPDNIFIRNNSGVDELYEFIEKPYRPLPMAVKEKYSFRNWLHYALDEGEYTSLSIPQHG